MNAKIQTGFEMGKMDGLTWDEVTGHAAETAMDDGDVYYRGKFLCTAYNDSTGGDIVDAGGRSMTDYDVQSRINAIDRALKN